MRAVIMEMNNRHMVVIKEDGTFEKVNKSSGVEIGDEITLSVSKVNWRNINRYVGIAASIMLVLVGGIQAKAYYTPYGYMNIDINPSIELGFNKYERIISIRGLNADGEKVLQKTTIKHSKIEDATRSIVETASKDNYIKSDQENDIMFSLYTPSAQENKDLNIKINNSVINYLNSNGRKAELINEIVSKEELDKAILQKISIGKLKLYEKAKKVDESITIEDIKDKPVRDIMKMIRTNKKEDVTEQKASKNKIKYNKEESNKRNKYKSDIISLNEKADSVDNIKSENNNEESVEKKDAQRDEKLKKDEIELKRNSNSRRIQSNLNINFDRRNNEKPD